MFQFHLEYTYLPDIEHQRQNHLILLGQFLKNPCQYQNIRRVKIQDYEFFLFLFHLRLNKPLKIFLQLVDNENILMKLQ